MLIVQAGGKGTRRRHAPGEGIRGSRPADLARSVCLSGSLRAQAPVRPAKPRARNSGRRAARVGGPYAAEKQAPNCVTNLAHPGQAVRRFRGTRVGRAQLGADTWQCPPWRAPSPNVQTRASGDAPGSRAGEGVLREDRTPERWAVPGGGGDRGLAAPTRSPLRK